MAGTPFMQLGPDTVQVSVPVLAGQGLEPDPTTGKEGLYRPWSVGSKTAMGWARAQAVPAGTNATNNFAPVPKETGLQWVGDLRAVYLAAAKCGDWLVCGANGTVTPAADQAAPGPFTVARCSDPKGVQAGATGRARSLL